MALWGQRGAGGIVGLFSTCLGIESDVRQASIGLGTPAEQGRLDDALACFRRALELAPNDAATHNDLAVALTRHGKADELLYMSRHARELIPDNASFHSNLGESCGSKGTWCGYHLPPPRARC